MGRYAGSPAVSPLSPDSPPLRQVFLRPPPFGSGTTRRCIRKRREGKPTPTRTDPSGPSNQPSRSPPGSLSTAPDAEVGPWPTCRAHTAGDWSAFATYRTLSRSPTTLKMILKSPISSRYGSETEPGSVVFHHSLTVHEADANSGPNVRRVYCIIYFADGCVRRSPIPHMTPDRQGIAVGEPIQGEVSPIVWPRPLGDLPPAPRGRPPRLGFG